MRSCPDCLVAQVSFSRLLRRYSIGSAGVEREAPKSGCAQTTIFLSSFNLICPVQSSAQKNSLPFFRKLCFSSLILIPLRGAARDRHGRWSWDAVDVMVCSARLARRRKHRHGRRRRVVLI